MRLASFALVALAAGSAAAEAPVPHALETWDNAARTSLPIWLMAWLGFLVLTFLASLFFVKAHVAARIALAGFVVSHALVIAIEQGELLPLSKGLVSVTHAIGWTPALVAMLRELGRSERRTRYGWWCRQMLFVLVVALIFDYRDAGMYLYYRLTGHPAL